GRLDKLPSIPETYWVLTRAIEDPSARTDDIARIVQRDPAMCAKVLQLVNSAYFGLARPVSSVAQAITFLGLDLLKGLALTLNVFATTEATAPEGISYEKIQHMSMLTAKLAKQMAPDPKEAEAAFTAGLIHDVGLIILALSMPDRVTEVFKVSAATGRPAHEVELELLGATHAEVGGYLLGVWGLPLPIVEAVAYHHALPSTPRERMDAAMAVYVADALADGAFAEAAGRPQVDLPNLAAVLEPTGKAGDLPRWRELAAREARAILARQEH
ncbi:MAG TPA: HDOD domain-containing protein, partial [Candidatus Acidoferrum sp.]|nr:HDOD domain-containing protein [Candidatus Acidoferrum sp.]